VGEIIAEVANGRLDTLLALFDCIVRQANQKETDTSVNVHLDGDGDGVDAEKGASECLY
jgi:hypothetical protein